MLFGPEAKTDIQLAAQCRNRKCWSHGPLASIAILHPYPLSLARFGPALTQINVTLVRTNTLYFAFFPTYRQGIVMKSFLIGSAFAVAALAATMTVAQDRTQVLEQQRIQQLQQSQQQIRDQDIYGSQLMTAQERDQYRQRMLAAKTEQEREQIRLEHHQKMTARAKERGITLPAQPPAGGAAGGMGPGSGPGFGAGGGRGR
jgi:hypothetical protein